jgi:RNA polymerase sigma-70 factor (ECF subfamily)
MDRDREASVESLVARARAGDRDAFRALFERHRDRLRAAVERRLGGYLRRKIEVEDVVQETFLKAFESLETFEARGEDSFHAWLRGIAENLLLWWARRHQRREQLRLDGDVAGAGTSPSHALRREERFERLRDALSRVEGLKLAEIAARLGRTPAAVKPLLWRALRKLRAAFGETESFSLPARSLAPNDVDRGGRDGP